jgi:uncharacterized iron-regulated membrane protein
VTADNVVEYILAFVAAFFASANVVGGYVVTGRMLKMFRRKAPQPQPAEFNGKSLAVSGFSGSIQLVYVLAAACFVIGLHLMNSLATARHGNQGVYGGHGDRLASPRSSTAGRSPRPSRQW